MLNESRRTLLTNVAKAVPLTAIAIATGSSKSVMAAPKGGNSTTALVNGVATDAAGALAGIFQGTLTVTGVQLVNGVLSAVGNLVGNVVDPSGNVLQSVTQSVSSPLQVTATCTILDLTLGPLDLNLLGLRVQLNQVHLLITAEQGAGNLLGNLLCGVANLLNGGGALSNLLSGLQNLLNQILGAV